MFDTRKTLHEGGILGVIKILAANGESGRLEMRAGTVEGAFFFRNGQLVDARVGHLTGFQAVNAVAAMREARFNFDPSVAPPEVSSITPNERVVLKQFFGIETINPYDHDDIPVYSDGDEVTIETHRIPVEALPSAMLDTPSAVVETPSAVLDTPDAAVLETPSAVPDIPAAMLDTPSSRSLYRGGLILAVLFILIALGAVVLRNKYRERVLSASAATTEQPASPSVAEQVPASAPVAKAAPVSAPVAKKVPASASVAKEVPASAPVTEKVKTHNAPTSVAAVDQPAATAQDLTGNWSIVNTVHKTLYRPYDNLQVGFDLSINQSGKSFTGKGQKVSENGRILPAHSRTPIQLKGRINGDTIEATFFEDGALRKTNGRFVWRIDKTGALSGTFVSTAAASSGKSAARKS